MASRSSRRTQPAPGGQRVFLRILVGLLLVVAVAWSVAIYLKQETQLQRVAERKLELQDILAVAQAEQDELLALQDQVDTDAYIEHIAREKLGMVKPDEVVFEED